MNKIYQTHKANNRPTTTQMKLLHWLTQLELSGNGKNMSPGVLTFSKPPIDIKEIII